MAPIAKAHFYPAAIHRHAAARPRRLRRGKGGLEHLPDEFQVYVQLPIQFADKGAALCPHRAVPHMQIRANRTVRKSRDLGPMTAGVGITGTPWVSLTSPAACHVVPLVRFLRSNSTTDQPALAR